MGLSLTHFTQENTEVREKLALALSGIACVDGLLATVAKAVFTPTFDLHRGDIVTVLSAEGEYAKISFEGETGS
jgi:hypothetical protein